MWKLSLIHIFSHSQDGVDRACHAKVCDGGRAHGGDGLVGSLDVGVGANHRCDPSVEVSAKRQLFAGGLGMEVHDAHRHVGRLFQQAVGRAEGTVDIGKEGAPNQVDDGHPPEGLSLIHILAHVFQIAKRVALTVEIVGGIACLTGDAGGGLQHGKDVV